MQVAYTNEYGKLYTCSACNVEYNKEFGKLVPRRKENTKIDLGRYGLELFSLN